MTTRTFRLLPGKVFNRRAPVAIGCLAVAAVVGVATMAALSHTGSAPHHAAAASVTTAAPSPSRTDRVITPAAGRTTAPVTAPVAATPVTVAPTSTRVTAELRATRVAARRNATARAARRTAARRTARAARRLAARQTARVAAARTTPTTTPTTTATTTPTTTPTTTAAPASTESDCTLALAYLAAHANPAYSQSCQPDPDNANAAQTNWVDGGSSGSIVIYDPACPASYENEASNSWFDFAALPSDTTSITLGEHDARGRTWDPFGACQ